MQGTIWPFKEVVKDTRIGIVSPIRSDDLLKKVSPIPEEEEENVETFDSHSCSDGSCFSFSFRVRP
jgi:hypothetical protein